MVWVILSRLAHQKWKNIWCLIHRFIIHVHNAASKNKYKKIQNGTVCAICDGLGYQSMLCEIIAEIRNADIYYAHAWLRPTFYRCCVSRMFAATAALFRYRPKAILRIGKMHASVGITIGSRRLRPTRVVLPLALRVISARHGRPGDTCLLSLRRGCMRHTRRQILLTTIILSSDYSATLLMPLPLRIGRHARRLRHISAVHSFPRAL